MARQDVSPGGFRFRTFSFLPFGARMLIELRFPDGPPVRATGRAAWVRSLAGGEGFEVGGAFAEEDTKARSAVALRLASLRPAPRSL